MLSVNNAGHGTKHAILHMYRWRDGGREKIYFWGVLACEVLILFLLCMYREGGSKQCRFPLPNVILEHRQIHIFMNQILSARMNGTSGSYEERQSDW